MDSTDQQDRTLKSGMTLPIWVKKQVDSRYDFDPAYSPPTYEEDFFYIRYPKSSKPEPNKTKEEKTFHDLSEVLEQQGPALAKHTEPCKEFIPYINKDEKPPQYKKTVKPMGTDDGFHGEAAACGKSVVAVAHQMLSGRLRFNSKLRGFTTDDNIPPEKYIRQRRNSKSLPASPLTSPTSTPDTSPQLRRKNMHPVQNRFFTGPFINKEDQTQNDEKKASTKWIFSGLLSQQREGTPSKIIEKSSTSIQTQHTSVSEKTIVEETRENLKDTATSDITDNTKITKLSVDVDIKSVSAEKHAIFRAKPSELREMNFWSPTSM